MVETAPRALRADARRNYESILRCARDAFASNGVGTSLDDIARAAGVGPGTLYRHFPTRDALLAEAFADNMRALSESGESLAEQSDPLAALRSWIQHLAQQVGTYGGLPDAVLAAAGQSATAFGADCTTLESITDRLVARARAAGGIRAGVTSESIFLLTNALAWASDRREAGPGERDEMFEILMRGIAV